MYVNSPKPFQSWRRFIKKIKWKPVLGHPVAASFVLTNPKSLNFWDIKSVIRFFTQCYTHTYIPIYFFYHCYENILYKRNWISKSNYNDFDFHMFIQILSDLLRLLTHWNNTNQINFPHFPKFYAIIGRVERQSDPK